MSVGIPRHTALGKPIKSTKQSQFIEENKGVCRVSWWRMTITDAASIAARALVRRSRQRSIGYRLMGAGGDGRGRAQASYVGRPET
jgi:hypothetical protein